jgi:very-long-chain enoyl-CoA reductase
VIVQYSCSLSQRPSDTPVDSDSLTLLSGQVEGFEAGFLQQIPHRDLTSISPVLGRLVTGIMSSDSLTLQLRPRGIIREAFSISIADQPQGKPIRKLPEELTTPRNSTASDLYNTLAQVSNLSVHRLRVTKGSDGTAVANSKDIPIISTGLRDQSTVYVKDLGPQIAWRTVFIVEYLGPLLIHPLIYFLRPYLYRSGPTQASYLQALSCLLICAHFLKRELETLFVHRFSASTMPASNIFKNSFHYWVLAGVNIAAWIYAPGSPTAKEPNMPLLYAGLLAYTVGELGNLNAHLVLRGLRSSGGRERGIPRGLGFDLVTCPNYMFEVLTWIGMLLISGLSVSVLLFAIVSTGQMMPWATKKERNYRKEFGDKYKKKRFTMLPGVW